MVCKIIDNLYFNMCSFPFFKDVYGMHMNWIRSPLNRSVYHVIDIEKWFESDFEDGCVLEIKRVSENAKYELQRSRIDAKRKKSKRSCAKNVVDVDC